MSEQRREEEAKERPGPRPKCWENALAEEIRNSKDRFESKVDKTDGCWVWIGTRLDTGYGVFSVRRKSLRAHRVALVLYRQETLCPDLVVDHACRNKACVNPDHLRQVSVKENTLIGEGPTAKNARARHCIRGHEMNEQNTRYRTRPGGGRYCRACRDEYRKGHGREVG